VAGSRCAMVVLPVLLCGSSMDAPARADRLFGRALAFVRNRQMLAGAGLHPTGSRRLGGCQALRHAYRPTQPAAVRTAGLYRWVTTTPADSLFLTPTDMVDFRLATGRAIVVDDKAVPRERARPGMVSPNGRRRRTAGMATIAEASAGYRLMDSARIDMLAQKYHLDYAVIGNTARIRI